MTDDVRELIAACIGCVTLFEFWRDGIFKTIGVEWVEEPPAIWAARKALERFGL